MGFIKKYPIFTVFIALSAILFVGGMVMAFLAHGKYNEQKQALASATRDLNRYLSADPAPVSKQVTRAQAQIADLRSGLERRLLATQGEKRPDWQANSPATGTEMLFQLEALKSEFTKEALLRENEAGDPIELQIPENFNFGFSRFIDAGTPPDDGNIVEVFKQKEIIRYLLTELYDTNALSLNSIRRKPVQVVRNSRGQANLQSDEFEIAPALSARVAGIVDTTAFEIVFTGYTESLRDFLTSVESFEYPLVVRSVEVSKVQGQSRQSSDDDDARSIFDQPAEEAEMAVAMEGAREPVVTSTVSQFTVTIEYIEVNPEKVTDISTVELPDTDASS